MFRARDDFRLAAGLSAGGQGSEGQDPVGQEQLVFGSDPQAERAIEGGELAGGMRKSPSVRKLCSMRNQR